MPSYFPSKKVLAVGVLAIGLLAWSIVYQNTSQQNSAITNNPLRTVAQAESAFPDADKDGLYDWEETLYGTDPEDDDSDNDGILDGKQYIKEKRGVELSLSDSVYAAVNRIGEEIQNTPDPLSLLSTTPRTYPNHFSSSDLNILNSNQEHFENYVVDALIQLSPHKEVLNVDPMKIIEVWLQTNDDELLEEIKRLSAITKKIANDFVKVPVPQEFSTTHLEIANNLYLSSIALDEVEITPSNPTGGFFAVVNYVNYQSKYLNAVNQLIDGGAKLYEN